MKILLLSNQPERTTRLKLFQSTLKGLEYQVVVPRFNTRNWFHISKEAKDWIRKERPDVVHLFNVPDVIYHGLQELKGRYFQRLIYDYRSPWGVELQMSFGPLARMVGERYERELVRAADLITTVNKPLGDKVMMYEESEGKPLCIVPNYPSRTFIDAGWSEDFEGGDLDEEAIIFVGRISRQEGIGNLLGLAEDMGEYKFWVVGHGPFAWWYLRKKPDNVEFFGWQSHNVVAQMVRRAKLCVLPHSKTLLTPYATDKSVWKLNEYLNMGKIVVASGITAEEHRKNLMVVQLSDIPGVIEEAMYKNPEKLNLEDFRLWEDNSEKISGLYRTVA